MSAIRCHVVLALRSATGSAGMRPALAAAALIKEHNAVVSGIEKTPHFRVQPSAGSTVQEDRGLACRIAAFLPVDLLAIAYIKHPADVRLDRWVQRVGTSVLWHLCGRIA